MTRSAESIAFEADYWKAILDDCLTINDRVADCAGHLRQIPLSSTGVGLDELASGLRNLQDIQHAITRIGRVADGRSKALRDELDEAAA